MAPSPLSRSPSFTERHLSRGRYSLDGSNFLGTDAVIHGDRVGSSVIIFWTGHLARVTNGLSGRLRCWACGIGPS
jgi:hypothetical protein